MVYLIPSLSQYIIAMVCKFPDFCQQYIPQLQQISKHLLSTSIRMEREGMQIASSLFERVGLDTSFLKEVLVSIF